MSRVDEILAFWFGELRDDKAYYDERSRIWFTQNPHFDQEVTSRFAIDYQLAAHRRLTDWQDTPRGGLALILLLDQVPRNMFRGDRRAFATDALARAAADHLIQLGFDVQLRPVERLFVYLPFMHSEDLEQQWRSVTLFRQLAETCDYCESSYVYATKHLEIIERFGRFPHRNLVLGRVSTLAEVEFLRQQGSPF
jgi:uncharacterized protein (DUF924 family)